MKRVFLLLLCPFFVLTMRGDPTLLTLQEKMIGLGCLHFATQAIHWIYMHKNDDKDCIAFEHIKRGGIPHTLFDTQRIMPEMMRMRKKLDRAQYLSLSLSAIGLYYLINISFSRRARLRQQAITH